MNDGYFDIIVRVLIITIFYYLIKYIKLEFTLKKEHIFNIILKAMHYLNIVIKRP